MRSTLEALARIKSIGLDKTGTLRTDKLVHVGIVNHVQGAPPDLADGASPFKDAIEAAGAWSGGRWSLGCILGCASSAAF